MDKELNSSYAIHEIPVNGWLYYCSGKKKESSNRETSLVISVGIGKDAIEGYLIYAQTITRIQLSYKQKNKVY